MELIENYHTSVSLLEPYFDETSSLVVSKYFPEVEDDTVIAAIGKGCFITNDMFLCNHVRDKFKGTSLIASLLVKEIECEIYILRMSPGLNKFLGE